jgi:flagellar biosynthesis regulator FlaF
MADVKGDHNVVIEGVSDSTITLNINGENKEVLKKLDALQDLLQQFQASSITSANNVYALNTLSDTNFDFIVHQAAYDNQLPSDLAQNLVTTESLWVQSLKQELLKQNVSVGNTPWSIFQHYGWMIEAFLQKMETPIGKQRTLRRLSFMAEAFQNSLRYLCYIQIVQLISLKLEAPKEILSDFFEQDEHSTRKFNYLNFLLVITDILQEEDLFMPEVLGFVERLADIEEDLYGTALYLDTYRYKLLNDEIAEGETLNMVLDNYLTALVFWLRQLSFIAKYRLVSIKDINLNYKFGTKKYFVHLFGELHGIYNEMMNTEADYSAYSVEGDFTYNHSVLLFKGSNIQACLENISSSPPLSLSPLLVDFSVYTDKPTQTPDIYYYLGLHKKKYLFAQYKNELAFGEQQNISSNKHIQVKRQNIKHPKMDELYDQLERVLKPVKR